MEYIELDVWKEARELVVAMYEVTSGFPQEEKYGLTAQIRRCSVSIPSNIAEGTGRRTAKDTLQFLYISRGSLYELETQLYIANDLNFLEDEDLKQSMQKIISCKKLLNGFINYYKKLK